MITWGRSDQRNLSWGIFDKMEERIASREGEPDIMLYLFIVYPRRAEVLHVELSSFVYRRTNWHLPCSYGWYKEGNPCYNLCVICLEQLQFWRGYAPALNTAVRNINRFKILKRLFSYFFKFVLAWFPVL